MWRGTLNWASGVPMMMTTRCMESFSSAGAIWRGQTVSNKYKKRQPSLMFPIGKKGKRVDRSHRHITETPNFTSCPTLTLIEAPAKCDSCLMCWPCFPMMAPTASAGMNRWTVSDSGCPCWENQHFITTVITCRRPSSAMQTVDPAKAFQLGFSSYDH